MWFVRLDFCLFPEVIKTVKLFFWSLWNNRDKICNNRFEIITYTCPFLNPLWWNASTWTWRNVCIVPLWTSLADVSGTIPRVFAGAGVHQQSFLLPVWELFQYKNIHFKSKSWESEILDQKPEG